MGHPSPGVPGQVFYRVSPPRMPKNYVERGATAAWLHQEGLRAALVQAPSGFGKTFLLSQWRRQYLAQGCVAPWIAVQPGDGLQQMVEALVYGFRLAAARPTFGHALLHTSVHDGLNDATAFLSEITQFALNTVLFVDDADRLDAAAREMLSYMVRNAPPNLMWVVATRADGDLGLHDLVTYGACSVVGGAALRFTLDETVQLVLQRLPQADRDSAARLHQMTEGWPLGLQLSLAMVGRSPNPAAALQDLLAQGHALQGDLIGQLLSQLAPYDIDWLTRVAAVDHIYPGLCRAVTEVNDIDADLERLATESTVLQPVEQGGFYRLHNLARQSLLARFAQLPEAERRGVHERAARWLTGQGHLDAAAWHALEAGDRTQAYDLAERSLYESLMLRGQQSQVVAWLERLPGDVVAERPALGLAVAWSLALGERNLEAGRWVQQLLALPQASDELRCECALILGGAAIFADDPDRFLALHSPWADSPLLRRPELRHIHLNRTAYGVLIQGNPSLARLKLQQGSSEQAQSVRGYLGQWGELVLGLTYLWEGQVRLAERLLQPTLAQADMDHGRRSPFACMLASFLEAAVWEQDRGEQAVTLLADRLDVLERHGLPEAVLLAYRTLARAAMQQGEEHRAMELLDAMYALGVARGMPRLCLASLTDQIRMHARRYRAETCRQLHQDAVDLVAAEAERHGPLWRQTAQALLALAGGYNAVASRRWRDAAAALAEAYEGANRLRMGRLKIEILGLKAFALDQVGEQAQDLLREALDLAQAYGLNRVFADVHPDLGAWLQRVNATAAPAAPLPRRVEAPAPSARPPGLSVSSLALTPKEREVLDLLARNLSNKEIGLALDVGEETVKWHMKNLFTKLDAGNRKQVVARARLFGLIAA